MEEAQLNNLKQFIAAAVSQGIANSVTKDDIAKLSAMINDLDLKVDAVSQALNDNLGDHETRITRLEQQSA